MAFCAYNEYQRRQAEEVLGEESLFICLHEHLNERVMIDPQTLNYDYSFVEVWEDAKFLINLITKEKHPTLHARTHIKSIYSKYETFSHELRGSRDIPSIVDYYTLSPDEKQAIEQCTLMCAYFMISISRNFYDGPQNCILNKILTWIEEEITWDSDRKRISNDLWLDNVKALLVNDYDYWEGKPNIKEINTNDSGISNPEIISGLRNEISELKKKLEEANTVIESMKEQGEEEEGEEVEGEDRRKIPTAREAIGIVKYYNIDQAYETHKDCERVLSQLTGLSVKTFYKHWQSFEKPNEQPAKSILDEIQKRDEELKKLQKRS